jgi:hypothetical protein
MDQLDCLMENVERQMVDGRRVRVPGSGHIKAFLDAEFAVPIALEFLMRVRS